MARYGSTHAILALLALATQAQASENAASLYLLGSGGPGAAILPPVRGVFVDSTMYFYSGSAGGGRTFNFNGNLVANADGTIAADFATLLWTPSTHFAGGTLALGAVVPFGALSLDANAVITGPRGRQISGQISESSFTLADPIGTASLGWKKGDFSWQLATLLNVPIGQYTPGSLVNLSFHRWAGDVSLAGTWHDMKSGWDVSGKLGTTFNGTNHDTQYTTGTELHLEGAVAKEVAKGFWLGAQAYYFDQLSGDSGPGAKLGPFKGREFGVGGTASHDFVIGKTPGTVRLRALGDISATNRLKGKSVWLEITFPLSMKLPPASPAG